METETEPRKEICVDPATYKTLKDLAENKNMTVQEYVDSLFKSVTTFDSKPEQNHVSIDIPVTAEQFTKLRAWLDADDIIEIYTGPREEKAAVVLVNSRQLWRRNHPGWDHDEIGEPLQLRIAVMSPFIDFIKEFQRFFGSKEDLETFCMKAIYDRVRSLNGDLEKFAGTHGLNADDWLQRFNERTHGYDPDSENDC